MSVPAGWSADPYGRYAQRYWNGDAWTAHVVTGEGAQIVDPMGTSMFIPMITPETAFPATPTAPATTQSKRQMLFGSGGASGFLESLGNDAQKRKDPTLRGAFGALGGVILGGGLAALILGNDPNRAVGVVIGLLMMGLAAVARIKATPTASDVRSGAVALLTIGILLACSAISGNSPAWFAFLAGLLGLAAWIAPPFRGHPFLLGAGAYGIVFAIGTAISNAATSNDPFDDQSGELQTSLFGLNGAARNTGLFFLFAALAVAFIVYRVDRRGFQAVSTPLLVTAMLSSLTGVIYFGLAINNSGGYLVATLVGAILASVASRANHRATLWFGAAMASGGFTAFVYAVTKPGGIRASGALAVVIGAVVVLAPRLLAKIRTAQDDRNPTGAQ